MCQLQGGAAHASRCLCGLTLLAQRLARTSQCHARKRTRQSPPLCLAACSHPLPRNHPRPGTATRCRPPARATDTLTLCTRPPLRPSPPLLPSLARSSQPSGRGCGMCRRQAPGRPLALRPLHWRLSGPNSGAQGVSKPSARWHKALLPQCRPLSSRGHHPPPPSRRQPFARRCRKVAAWRPWAVQLTTTICMRRLRLRASSEVELDRSPTRGRGRAGGRHMPG